MKTRPLNGAAARLAGYQPIAAGGGIAVRQRIGDDAHLPDVVGQGLDGGGGMLVGVVRIEVDLGEGDLDALAGQIQDGNVLGLGKRNLEVRFLPLERMNSILVITANTTIFPEVERWMFLIPAFGRG